MKINPDFPCARPEGVIEWGCSDRPAGGLERLNLCSVVPKGAQRNCSRKSFTLPAGPSAFSLGLSLSRFVRSVPRYQKLTMPVSPASNVRLMPRGRAPGATKQILRAGCSLFAFSALPILGIEGMGEKEGVLRSLPLRPVPVFRFRISS